MRNPKPRKLTPRQESLYAEAERSSLRARAAGIGAARLLGDFPSNDEILIARELLDEALGHYQNAERCRRIANAQVTQRNGRGRK